MLLGSSHLQLQILFTKALGRTTNGYTADDSLCWGTVGSPVQMQPASTLVISSLSCRSKQITRFWWNSVFLGSREESSFLALRYPCTFFRKQVKSTHVWRPRVWEREKCLCFNEHFDGWIQEQMEQGALVQDNCSTARRPKLFASLVFTFLELPLSSIRTTEKQHQKGNPPQTSAAKGNNRGRNLYKRAFSISIFFFVI